MHELSDAIDQAIELILADLTELFVSLEKILQYPKENNQKHIIYKLRLLFSILQGRDIILKTDDTADKFYTGQSFDLLQPHTILALEKIIIEARSLFLKVTETEDILQIQHPEIDSQFLNIDRHKLHPLYINGYSKFEQLDVERLKTILDFKKTQSKSLSIAEEIICAAYKLILTRNNCFTRRDLREILNINNKQVWDSYATTFNKMRVETKMKTNIEPRYLNVFHSNQLGRGFYALTDYGHQLALNLT